MTRRSAQRRIGGDAPAGALVTARFAALGPRALVRARTQWLLVPVIIAGLALVAAARMVEPTTWALLVILSCSVLITAAVVVTRPAEAPARTDEMLEAELRATIGELRR